MRHELRLSQVAHSICDQVDLQKVTGSFQRLALPARILGYLPTGPPQIPQSLRPPAAAMKIQKMEKEC